MYVKVCLRFSRMSRMQWELPVSCNQPFCPTSRGMDMKTWVTVGYMQSMECA